MVAVVVAALFAVQPSAWATSCAGLANDLDAGRDIERLFAATVLDTTHTAALVRVDEVWAGPDLAPEAWVAGLGHATVGSQWLLASTADEVRVDGCGMLEVTDVDVDRRAPYEVKPPVEGGDTGSVPLTARLTGIRPVALSLLVGLVAVVAWLARRAE